MKKYILGMFTAICFIPLLESFTELLQTILEIPKGMISKSVIKLNSEIQNLQAESEPVSTNCIGFEIPNELDYDDAYEDRKNNRIGF